MRRRTLVGLGILAAVALVLVGLSVRAARNAADEEVSENESN